MANAYQWYPGHMMKARREVEEDIKLIDLVIELVDARIPLSSRNPDIDELSRGKARLILLNKADLADPAANRAWEQYFASQGIKAVSLDSRKSGSAKRLLPVIREVCKERIERNLRRGIRNRPMRALICGIPNVGKSTFINSFAGKGVAKTGNKPGVTKGKQWIRLQKDLELLDTPGILWPRQSDPVVGERLAMIGSINDEIIEKQEMAFAILRYLIKLAPEALAERYGMDAEHYGVEAERCGGNTEHFGGDAEQIRAEGGTGGEEGPESAEAFYNRILEKIAESRKCLKKGGAFDTDKAAAIVIDDFRKGLFGKLTLDEVPAGETR